MRFNSTEEELRQLEDRRAAATGFAQIELLVEATWHLRHRDSLLALRRCEAAERMLDALAPDHTARHDSLRARLKLISGAAHLLEDRLDIAVEEVDAAMLAFTALNDDIGRSDACHVHARICNARNAHAERAVWLQQAADLARIGGDTERADIADARQALYESNKDLQAIQATQAKWGRFLEERAASPLAGVRGIVNEVLGAHATLSGDMRRGIECYIEAASAYRSVGQRDALIATMGNIGTVFASLNDYATAMSWLQEQIDIARSSGWRRQFAQCLLQAGTVLCHADRGDSGYAMLLEAESLLEGMSDKHLYSMLLYRLAAAELTNGRCETALGRVLELEALIGDESKSTEAPVDCLGLKARALFAMGDTSQALAAARAALALADAQGSHMRAQNALDTLVEIHVAHPMPAPAGSVWPNGALHYMYAAIAVSERTGAPPHSELLSGLASEHAKTGDFEKAYGFALHASEAHRRENSEIAMNRVIAMEVVHKTAHAEASALHHEQLAMAQQRRAEALAQTNDTLDRLGTVGQQITAHLDRQSVYRALNQHVGGLLDAASISIYLLSDDGLQLERVLGVEGGQSLPPRSIAMSDPAAHAAECARSRRELLVVPTSADGDASCTAAPGKTTAPSALFAPLLIGARLLGIMTIQSMQADAYGERERSIFRSLCAYGAIALANADAYRRLDATLSDLETAQEELLRKNRLQWRMNAEREETLAFLAHDLRAPLNAIVHMIPVAADDAALHKTRRFAERALSMTDRFLEVARLGLMSRETRVPLDLAAVVDDACETFVHRTTAQGRAIDVRLQFGAIVLGHREALMRAVCNLLDNALQASGQGGGVEVDLRSRAGRLELCIADRGPGMPQAAREMLLSSARGASGTGRLGLTIVAQVAELHDAVVTVHSTADGSSVCLAFPPVEPIDQAEKRLKSACSASACRSHASSENA